MKRTPVALLLGSVLGSACGQNPAGPSEPRAPAAAAPASKPAAPSPAAAGPRVLYDARDRAAPAAGVEREPKLAPEVEKKVFSSLAPSYKTRREECGGAGDVLLHATAAASGAFTAPAAKETLYLVAGEPCEPAERGSATATHLLIFDGEKLVAHASGKSTPPGGEPPRFFGTDIRALADLDQDGTSELLVTSSGAGHGVVEEIARLYTAKGGTIKLLKEFPGVYLDGCAPGRTAPRVQALVLRFAPGTKGATPPITSETYEAACAEGGGPKAADFKPAKPSPASPATR